MPMQSVQYSFVGPGKNQKSRFVKYDLIKEICHVVFWEDLSDAHGFPFHPCCGVRFCASPLEDRNDKDDLSNRNATSKQ